MIRHGMIMTAHVGKGTVAYSGQCRCGWEVHRLDSEWQVEEAYQHHLIGDDKTMQLEPQRRRVLLDTERRVHVEKRSEEAEHALRELEILFGPDATHHIDALIKARISEFPR